ncbi:MAG TPA: hypothetical protein VGA07_10845 [Anaerolineales bacterium]
MKFELSRGAVLAAALSIAGLACSLPSLPSLPGAEESAAVEGQPAEPAQVEPAEAPTQPAVDSSGGPESLNLDDPAVYQEPIGLVDSYRVELSYTFNGTAADGSPVSGIVQANGARTLSPEAMSMSFDGQGAEDLSAELPLKFSLIGGTYTIHAQDVGCATLPAGEFDDPFTILVDLGGFLTGQAARVRPDEEVNGVPVYRFVLENSNVDPSELDVEEVTSGAIYVAKQGGYVVRLEMAGRGTSEMLSGDPALVGDVNYLLSYFDFNQPVTIAPPEECALQAGGEAGEFPMVEDATDVFAVAGLMSYTSKLDFEAVLQFYKDQMPQVGWTLAEEFVAGPLGLLTFTSGDRSAQLTVTYDQGSDQVSVAILSGSR